MKLLFDFFPIIVFFVVYKLEGIYAATAVIIGASFLQVVVSWLKNRRMDKVYVWTFVTVSVLGGATLALRDPVFIKWKPSIVNWGLAIVFFGSQFVGGRPLVQRMMGAAMDMPVKLWLRLNMTWVAFFIFCGIANLFAAYQWSENAWVNFKLFGLAAFSLLFMFCQIFLLRGYLRPVREPAPPE